MTRIRPELMRGMAILGIFLVLVISTEILVPYSFQNTPYSSVTIKKIQSAPSHFEGQNVSSRASVSMVNEYGSYSLANTLEGPTLIFVGNEIPKNGDLILVRGTSWILSNNSIYVHEFYVLDYYSSILRSIPGIIVFAILFLVVYRIDFGQIAFVPRRQLRNA